MNLIMTAAAVCFFCLNGAMTRLFQLKMRRERLSGLLNLFVHTIGSTICGVRFWAFPVVRIVRWLRVCFVGLWVRRMLLV